MAGAGVRPPALPVLEEHAVEHGEDDVLLGLGETADALELALELGRGAALAGPGRRSVGNAEEDVGGHGEEPRELGDERDGDAKLAV